MATSMPTIPNKDAFKLSEGGNSDFLEGSELEDLARRLKEKHAAKFAHIDLENVTFLWKRQGGKRRGKLVTGVTKRVTAELEFLAGVSWLVELAADNCFTEIKSERQLEALLYRQLCYIGNDGAMKGPDFEGFTDELTEYGLWNEDYKLLDQLPLWRKAAEGIKQEAAAAPTKPPKARVTKPEVTEFPTPIPGIKGVDMAVASEVSPALNPCGLLFGDPERACQLEREHSGIHWTPAVVESTGDAFVDNLLGELAANDEYREATEARY